MFIITLYSIIFCDSCFFPKSVDRDVTVILKDVFASEELETNVTSGESHRLQDSLTAVDVRNATFDWPYGRNGNVNDGVVNAGYDSEQNTLLENSTKKPHKGFKYIHSNIYSSITCRLVSDLPVASS